MAVDSHRCPSYDSKASQLKGWVSLYDVMRRKGTYFLNVYRLLVAFEQLVATPRSRLCIQRTSGSPIDSNPLNPPTLFSDLLKANLVFDQPVITLEQINTQLTLVEDDANELGLEGTADRIRAIREYVSEHATIDFQGDEHLRHDVRVLRETLISELERRWIFFPDLQNFRKYFNKSFGDEVDDAFPEAQRDTASAANSYIYGEPTACVFHCMRTAEYGLARSCEADTADVARRKTRMGRESSESYAEKSRNSISRGRRRSRPIGRNNLTFMQRH